MQIRTGGYPQNMELEFPKCLFEGKTSLLLDANEWYSTYYNKRQPTSGAYFEIATSRRKQTTFLTTWRLFDHPEILELVLDGLAKIVNTQIRPKTRFDGIVTSTATAKTLLDQLHSRIEVGGAVADLHVLPQYPFLRPDRRSTWDLSGQSLLVFTDVVAKGELLRHLTRTIERLGGRAVAALCMSVVNPTLIEAKVAAGYIPFEIDSTTGHRDSILRLYSLADHEIPDSPDISDESKKVEIDWSSVMPQSGHHEYPPTLFSVQETYDLLEDAEAIDFGFFQHDDCRFLTAVRLRRLLNRKGQVIWDRIKLKLIAETRDTANAVFPPFASSFLPPRFVSSFQASDRDFCQFLAERSYVTTKSTTEKESTPLPPIYLHHVDKLAEIDSIHLRPGYADELFGRDVVLALTSVHSSETLRSLCTQLATHDVKSITVVCLLNRMGPATNAFISRIERMLLGLRAPSPESTDKPDAFPHNFKFLPVLDFSEFSTENVECLAQSGLTLLELYQSRTRVPAFRRASERLRKYLSFQGVTSTSFVEGTCTRLTSDVQVKVWNGSQSPDNVTVRTLEGKFSLLCRAAANHRDYEGILREISGLSKSALNEASEMESVSPEAQQPIISPPQRKLETRHVIRLYAVLLRDVSYLRLRRLFPELRESLLDQLRTLRITRLKAEKATSFSAHLPQQIIDSLEREWLVTVGLGLFSFLDSNHDDYVECAREILFHGLDSFSSWLDCPENALRHFADDRVVWMTSFVLKLADCEIPENFVSEVRHALYEFRARLHEFPKPSWLFTASPTTLSTSVFATPDLTTLTVQQCIDNLNLLLVELTGSQSRTRYRVIEALREHLLVPDRHSPIVTAFSEVERRLADLFSSASKESKTLGSVDSNIPGVQKALDAAIHLGGLLEQLADFARTLFEFTPFPAEDAKRYLAGGDSPGLTADVFKLANLFQRIRIDNRFSMQDVTAMQTLRNQIFTQLWDPTRPLQRVLKSYEVDLREAILEAMVYAKKAFQERGAKYKKCWDAEIHRIGKEVSKMRLSPQNGTKVGVLCDPTLLRETLRNVCLNVKHSFLDYKRKTFKNEDGKKQHTPYHQLTRVTLSPLVQIDDSGVELHLIKLDFTVTGTDFIPTNLGEQSTLSRQFGELKKYGCDATAKSNSGQGIVETFVFRGV